MSTEQGSAVSAGQRALAWLSIACAVALTVVLVIFSVRNLGALVAVVVGVAVAGAGGWWLITEHSPRRWIGLGGAVVGVGIVVAAVVVAADGDRPLLRVALVLVLFAVTIGAARLAMVRHLHVRDAAGSHVVTRPRHPVLICNPWSGGGKVIKFGLVEVANELGVETVMLDHGLDLEQLARDESRWVRTAWGWRVETVHRRSWRRSRSNAGFLSSVSQRAHETTSPRTSGWIARTLV